MFVTSMDHSKNFIAGVSSVFADKVHAIQIKICVFSVSVVNNVRFQTLF